MAETRDAEAAEMPDRLNVAEASIDETTGKPFYYYLIDPDAGEWTPWFETWGPRGHDVSRYAAERFAACWNALAGIEDPQAFVESLQQLQEENARLRGGFKGILSVVAAESIIGVIATRALKGESP